MGKCREVGAILIGCVYYKFVAATLGELNCCVVGASYLIRGVLVFQTEECFVPLLLT